jgi:hypothetical protein
MWNRFIKQFTKIASTLLIELLAELKKKNFTSEMELASGRHT